MTASGQPPRVPFARALRVWLRIGLLGFGGPAGQIALMHRELVDRHRWIGERRFLHALNYCMLLPGPEAQQLATYIGWLMHGTRGGLAAGLLFVLPGFLAVLALSFLYVLARDLPPVAAAFFGLKAAVLAVVLEALVRIGRRALTQRWQTVLAAVAFLAIFALRVPFPAIVLGAGLLGAAGARWAPRRFAAAAAETGTDDGDTVIGAMAGRGELDHTQPDLRRTAAVLAAGLTAWFAPLALLRAALGADSVFVQLGRFFSQVAVVTFGGAYAVLAYVAQQAVDVRGWLLPGEMLDGLGLAETTPGPLILVLQFVGFLAGTRHPGSLDALTAGVLGAMVTVWATFAPCFVWIFLGAPWIERLRHNPALAAAMAAITAAVVGVMLNLAVWFAAHLLFDRVATRRLGPLHVLLPDAASLDHAALALVTVAALALLGLRMGLVRVLALSALLGVAARGLG